MFAKVMFSQVSVCPQGAVCPIACWDTLPWTDTPNPPWADTPPPWVDTRPPLGRHPPGQTPPGRHPTLTPWADTPLGRHPPPGQRLPPPPPGQTPLARCMLACGQHPTGMHSCLGNFFTTRDEKDIFTRHDI